MKRVNRVALVAAIFLCGLGIVSSIGGIVGSWLLRKPLTERILNVLSQAEDATARITVGTTVVGWGLEYADQRVADIQQGVDASTGNSPPQDADLVAVSDTLQKEILSEVDRAKATVDSIHQTRAMIANTLQAVNATTFVSFTGQDPKFARLERLSNDLPQLAKVIESSLADARENHPDQERKAVASLIDKLPEIDQRLQETREGLAEFEAHVDRIGTDLTVARIWIPIWLTLGAAGLTCLLLWSVLAQFSLLMHCRSFLMQAECERDSDV